MNATIDNFRLRWKVAELERKLKKAAAVIEKQNTILDYRQKEADCLAKTVKYDDKQRKIFELQTELDEKLSALTKEYELLLEDWRKENAEDVDKKEELPGGQDRTQSA